MKYIQDENRRLITHPSPLLRREGTLDSLFTFFKN